MWIKLNCPTYVTNISREFFIDLKNISSLINRIYSFTNLDRIKEYITENRKLAKKLIRINYKIQTIHKINKI